MLKQSRLFHFICTLFAGSIIMLAAAPLLALAFQNSLPVEPAAHSVIQPKPACDEKPIAVTILDRTIHVIPANHLPFYDRLLVKDRRSEGLATEMPSIELYYADKVVYLTFDDGPHPEHTLAILDILKQNEIKATFFVVGIQAEKHPDVLRRIFNEGHAIGNHSYNHVYRDLYQSATAYTEQLQLTDEIIRREIGVRPRISRAPGGSAGSFTKAYWDVLKKDGYMEVGWNISSGDASAASAAQIISNIRRQLEQSFLWSHAIILMHDGSGHGETVAALPIIIKMLKDRHFEFRVVNAQTPPAW